MGTRSRAYLMSVLGHAVRRQILTLLRDGELSAGEISLCLHRPRPAVSHHLSILVGEGVLRRRSSSAFRYYALDELAALAAWDEYLRETLIDGPSAGVSA